MLWKCELLDSVLLRPKGPPAGMGSRLVGKRERKSLLLCLQLYFFIIAVDNLYNTAVENHSGWVAGPPTQSPGLLNPSISPAQSHLLVAVQTQCRITFTLEMMLELVLQLLETQAWLLLFSYFLLCLLVTIFTLMATPGIYTWRL